ncbi:MAG: HK97 family phage prohead protease [Bacteroidetes bacterium]|nr:HK97 family phage prohead protease [Bacteroidota bacterium]
MAKGFVLNDESRLNSYGFLVLNAGGSFDRFRENPVMLYLHEQEQLIGRWENLRTDGSKLIADEVFDTEDPEAMKLSGKVDRGFLKGSSMGLHILDAELKNIPGLGLVPAVTKWELMEASLAPVPSGQTCLRLYNEKGELITSKEAIKLSIDSIILKNNNTSMDKIMLTAEAATCLKVSKEIDPTALNSAIMALAASRDEAVTELKKFNETRAKELVDGAIKEGRLSADKKESFEKIAVSDFKQAKDLIDSLPVKQTLSDKIIAGSKDATKGRDDWNYLQWAKQDPKGLAKMQAEDPAGFEQLKANYKSA